MYSSPFKGISEKKNLTQKGKAKNLRASPSWGLKALKEGRTFFAEKGGGPRQIKL